MPLPEQEVLHTADVLAAQREPGFETDNLPSPGGFTAPQIAPVPIPGTGLTMGGTQGSQDYLTKFNQSILGTKDKTTPGNLPTYQVSSVYNPRYRSILPGEDSEEAFAKGQSAWDKWGNSIVKFGATAVGTFIEGMAAIPDTIASIAGNSPYNTTLGNNLDSWRDNLENRFPNYYTKWESEHPFRSAIPFSGGFANFWGDKFIKNLGFTAGAIASAALTDIVVGAATEGIGEIPLVGAQIGKAALWLNKLFTSETVVGRALGFEAPGKLTQLLDLGRAAGRTGEQLLDLQKLAQVAQGTKIANGFKYAVNLYGATASEAGIEARDGYNTIKRDLMIAYQRERGYSATGKDLEDIEKYATAGGNVRFAANMALLGVSNALQLDGILKGFSAAKAGIRSTIQKELESGAAVGLREGSMDTFEKLPKSIWGKVRPIVPSILTEGVFEEGGQYATQIAVENFYERKFLYDKGLRSKAYEKDETPFDSRDQIENIVHSVFKGLADEFTTDEGLENIMIGGLTGAVFGGVTRWMDRNKNAQMTNATLNLLNSQGVTGILSHQYTAAATSQRIAEDMKEAARTGDIFKYKNFQHEQFTNFIMSGIKAGRFDVRMEQLDMLKDMPEEEFKKAFGLDKTTDNVKTAAEYVDILKESAKKIKKSYDVINDTFTNPYAKNTKAKTKEEVEENRKHELFEEWKGDLTFLASINADTSERINSIGRELRTIDPNLDHYHVANFTDRAYLKSYSDQMDKEAKGLESLIKQGVSADKAADEKRARSLNAKSAAIDQLLGESKPDAKKFEALFGKLLNYHLNGQNDGGQERIPQEAIPKLIEYGTDIHRLRNYRESANKAFDKLSTEEGFNRYFREAQAADEKYATKKESQPPIGTQTTPTGQTATKTPPKPPVTPKVEVKGPKGQVKSFEEGKDHFVPLKEGANPEAVKVIKQNQDGTVTVQKADGSTEDIPAENFFAENKHAAEVKKEVNANTSVDDIPPNNEDNSTKVGDKKKDISFGLYSTTDPVYTRKDIPFNNFHRRHQNFLFNMGSSDPDVFNQDNKPKIRIIPVTAKTAQALGFPENFIENKEDNSDSAIIRAVYIIDDTIDPVARNREKEAIKRMVKNSKEIKSNLIKESFEKNTDQAIEDWYTQALNAEGIEDQLGAKVIDAIINYGGQGLFFTNSKGEKMGRVGEAIDPNQAIFSTFATTDLTFNEGENRYTNKDNLNEAAAQDWWRQQRADILAINTPQGAMQRTYKFKVSRGIPLVFNNGTRNSPIDVGLIRRQDLGKEIITIPTLGEVAIMGAYNQDDQGIPAAKSGVSMPPGTPLLNYGGNLVYLNARKFTPQEAENIFQILKVIADRSRTEDSAGLFKYLHKVIFMANPEKNIKTTNSSITIDGPNLFLGKNLAPIDMIPDALEAFKAPIIEFLLNAHHGIKNSELLKIKNNPKATDLSFQEIQVTNGQVTIAHTWPTYNHYLLDNRFPGGGTRTNTPLAVNLAVPQKDEVPIVQKYSVVDSFEFDPSKFMIANKAPQAQKAPTIKDSDSAINKVMTDVRAVGLTEDNLDNLRKGYEANKSYTDDEIGHLLGAVDFLKEKLAEAQARQGEQKVETPSQPKQVDYLEIGPNRVAFNVLSRDSQGNITDIEPLGMIREDGSITPFTDNNRAKALIMGEIASSQIKPDDTIDPDDDEGLGRGGFTQGSDRYRIFHPGNADYTKANLDQEFKEFKRMLGEDFFKLQKVNDMLKTTGGGLAWGALHDKMVYIYKNAKVGTTYHEAFEGVWYHFLTAKEQENIYKEFLSRKGEFTTFENKKKSFSKATMKEAKEQMAEEFSEYKLNGKLPAQQKQRTFFQKLLDFIKWLLGIENSDRNRLFKNINKGYYRNFATSLRGPMEGPEYSYYREPGLEQFSETIVQDVLQGMTSELLGKLFGENAGILDQLEKNFTTTAGSIYDRLKQDFTFYFEDKAAIQGTLTAEFGIKYQRSTNDEDRKQMIAQVRSIRETWQRIKTNWDSFVREHMRYLRVFNIEFVTDDEGNTQFSDDVIQGDDTNPEKNMSDYGQDKMLQDAKSSASYRIKLLIASIADSEWIREATLAGIEAAESVRSKRDSSSMALPKLVQYAKLFNYLLHNSSNINGFYGIWKKLTKITDDRDTRKPIDANVRKMMSRVPFDRGFDGKTRADSRMVLSLENTLTKQKPSFFRQFTDNLRHTYFRTTVLNSKISQVKDNWIAAIKGSNAVRLAGSNRFIFSRDILAIRDNIQFLNAIGIEIGNNDYRRLTGRRVQRFNDEVNAIRRLIQEAADRNLAIPVISSKQIDFSGRLNGLAELYVTYMVGEDTQSQHPNLENEQTSNFVLNNVVSTVVNDANESANRDEFINKEGNEYFMDTFHEDSILLNKVFFDFKTGQKAKSIEVGVVEGRETWDRNNKATSKLTEAERQLYEINNNLNGVFYTLLPADAKTEWALNIGTYYSADAFFGTSSQRSDEFDKFSNQMYRWLGTEIMLAQQYEKRSFIDNLRRIPKGETRPVGKSLRFFKDILPRDVVDDIHNRVIDGDSLLEDILTQDQMRAIIKGYINSKVARSVDNLTDWNVLISVNNTYRLFGFDKTFIDKHLGNKNEHTLEEVRRLFAFREINYVTNAIEMHKFFFGDPAQYTDELKRVKTFLSGREYTHVDMLHTSEGFNQWANTELNKTKEGQEGISLAPTDPGYQVFKNHFNTVVLRDVFTESNEIEALREALKDKVGPYEDINENDGGAYMTATAYREMLWRAGGRFSQQQEDQFQWEMAWERNRKAEKGIYQYSSEELRRHDDEILKKEPDTEVDYPILKLMHSGIVANEDIGVASIDKASWAPLFYRWYEDKGLGELYNAAQKVGMDYIKMKSAHKVGMVERSTIHMYNEDGTVNTQGFETVVAEKVPMRLIGIQVEQRKKEKGQTEGSQLRKIALADLKENGVPIDFMKDEANRETAYKEWDNLSEQRKREASPIYTKVERHNQALINLTLARTQSAMKRMGMIEQDGELSIPDKKYISDFILAELERRELPRNIAASIQISPETRDFSNPLESSPQYTKIRAIIYSILEKTITRPKVNGGQKTMLSVMGMESSARISKKTVNGKTIYTSDTLKFYKQSDTGTEACEVMLPYWFGKKLMEAGSGRTKEEVLDYLNKTEEGRKLLMGIGFRIPTQGLNSIDFFIVKDFLPEQMGDVVVLPSEITAKAGSDFDIDKLNTYLRNYYIDGKTGFPALMKYMGSEQATKENLLSLIQEGSITANSIRKDLERYITEETEGFEEGGLFESMPGVEDLFSNEQLIRDFLQSREINTLNMYYQKTLENEYFDAIQDLISLPENFSRLVQPNDATELKNYRDEILKLKAGETESLGEYGKLLDSTFMMQERQAYMSSKQVVGISAVSQTAHAMGQNVEGGLLVTNPDIVARFPHNEVDGKISLSGLTTAGGEGLISNINSQTTDGGVDVAKDKFLAEMEINQDTLSTFLTLVRMGAKPWWAILFLNQPSIQNFLKAKAISSSVSQINPMVAKENDKALMLRTMQEFGGPGEKNAKIANKPREYTMRQMQEMIRAYSNNPNSLSADQKILQMMLLDDFKIYNGLSWDLFHLYQGYNWDTARINDPNLVRLKELKYERALNLSVTPASKILSDTFIGTMREQILKLDQALRSTMNVQKGAAGEMLDNFARAVFYMAGGEAAKQSMLLNFETGMIDYAIQTGSNIEGRPLNSVIPLLLLSDRSVAQYVQALKRYTDDKKISENPFVKALIPDVDIRPGYPSIVRMPERDYDTYTSNVLTDSFRELKDDHGIIISIDNKEENNKSVAQIYKRLALLSIIQGGAKGGRGQFTHLIPSETYAEYVRDSLVNMKLDNFIENLVIYRTQWSNSNLVPFAETEYLDERDEFEGVPPVLMAMRVPEIINTLAQTMNVQPEQVPMILTPKAWSTKRYKVIKVEEQIPDPDHPNNIIGKRIRLFKRVDVDTDLGEAPLKYGKSGRLLFVEINAWGDPNIKEMYKEAVPSVLPTNNHVIEVNDQNILYAIEKAGVPTNASVEASMDAVNRFEGIEPDDTDDDGNTPIDPDPYFQTDDFQQFKDQLKRRNC